MKLRSTIWVLGAAGLAACSAVPGLLSGDSAGALDSYFATSVGKAAGHAQALAAACPSLNYNQAELDLHRLAICRGGGLADDCEVPNLATAMQTAFAETTALFSGKTTAQVCSDAQAEIASDSILAEYLK